MYLVYSWNWSLYEVAPASTLININCIKFHFYNFEYMYNQCMLFFPAVDPYVIVKCEGETVKSFWRRDTQTPEWDFRTIFYRKKPAEEPIYVEVRLGLHTCSLIDVVNCN